MACRATDVLFPAQMWTVFWKLTPASSFLVLVTTALSATACPFELPSLGAHVRSETKDMITSSLGSTSWTFFKGDSPFSYERTQLESQFCYDYNTDTFLWTNIKNCISCLKSIQPIQFWPSYRFNQCQILHTVSEIGHHTTTHTHTQRHRLKS